MAEEQKLGCQLDAVKFLALRVVAHRAAADVLNPAALEPVGLVLVVHLLILGKAGAGNMQQRVLLAAVDREVIVAALAGIHKLDVDVLADPFQIAVMPDLKREGRGAAAAFFLGPFVVAAGGMGINIVRLAEGNVDVAAIGLPSRLAGRKMLVGIGDAPVVLFAVLVFGRIRVGVAAQPEVLDEGVALFVVAQAHEGFALFVGDDVRNFLVQPGLVGPFQLLTESLLGVIALLVGPLTLERIYLLVLSGIRPTLLLACGCAGGVAAFRDLMPAAGVRTRPQPMRTKRKLRPLSVITFKTPAIPYFTGPERAGQHFLRSRLPFGREFAAKVTRINARKGVKIIEKGEITETLRPCSDRPTGNRTLHGHLPRAPSSEASRSLNPEKALLIPGTVRNAIAYTGLERDSEHASFMKKILLIILAVLVAGGLVAFMVVKQQSGYTKVLTATIVREDLSTVVSGTGQIKPKTYVNLGATAMGRVTHLYCQGRRHGQEGPDGRHH